MRMLSRMLTLPMLLSLQLSLLSAAEEFRDFSYSDVAPGFLEHWETAGRFLGIDTSQGVAHLVSSTFTPVSNKEDSAPPQPATSLFHGFFRLLGFDTTKLNAIAVNAVVFIAKMIGSSLIENFTGASSARGLEDEEVLDGSPLSWILQDVQSHARSLLSLAQEGDLAERMMQSLQEAPTDTDCVQLLVCRSSPLLAGMQRSLQAVLLTNQSLSWADLSPLQRMYHFLPSRQQLVDSAGSCARRVPSCSQLFSAFDD